MPESPRPRSEIASLILAKLTSGALPNVCVTRVWAGKGGGHICNGCDSPISVSEGELEVELGKTLVLRLHQQCFRIWQETLEVPHPSDDVSREA
ncbi:MAG TPA: hypothetical protein VFJ24_07550 [Gaiellales bacterium]|nr:hypothetical protein [Gaiellales bacterium]